MNPALVDAPHAVYLVFDRRWKLIYAGSTCNPRQRLNGHRKHLFYGRDVGHFEIVGWFPDRESAREAEHEVLWHLNPHYNVDWTPKSLLARQRREETGLPLDLAGVA